MKHERSLTDLNPDFLEGQHQENENPFFKMMMMAFLGSAALYFMAYVFYYFLKHW